MKGKTTVARRAMDLFWAVLILLLLWPVMVVIAVLILLRDGRPVFYLSERMQTPSHGFQLRKFRTMTHVASDTGVSGGDKVDRITATGRALRRYRLDELPQLVNILRGDIGFVGPRPPLRRYVERFPELYGAVLKDRPGVTGLATLLYHRHEERLLKTCATPQETEATYERRCIPRKAQIDLIYGRRRTLWSDFYLSVATVFRRLPPVHRKRP